MDKSSKPSEAHGYTNTSGNSFLNQLGPLLILTSIFFINFVSRIILAPLTPRIETDLNLTHADAGTLFFMISLGYFISLIGSGFVSSRFNHKRTIIISNTALGFAVIATAFCGGSWTMRLGLFALGMATGLYLPSGIATLMSIIPMRHWGKALAIHELAPNLSFVAAPLICEAVLIWFSWRAVFLLIGFAALIMGPVFWGYSRGGQFMGEAPSFASFRQLFGNLSVWVMVFLFSLGVISTMGIYTMLPLYLVAEQGMEREMANTLVAISRIPGLAIVFAAGWATDRFGPKRTLEWIFILTGILTMGLGFAGGLWTPVLVFLQPMIAVCFPPAALVALSLIGTRETRNIAVSITIPFAFIIGGGILPILIGIMGDAGVFWLGIVMVGGLILLASILPRYLIFARH